MADPTAPPADDYDPLTPVPQVRRLFGALDALSLWVSLGIGLLAPGRSLPRAGAMALLAIFLVPF